MSDDLLIDSLNLPRHPTRGGGDGVRPIHLLPHRGLMSAIENEKKKQYILFQQMSSARLARARCYCMQQLHPLVDLRPRKLDVIKLLSN